MAESALSGQVNATEPNGTQAVFQPGARPQSFFARLQSFVTFLPESFAATACPTLLTATCASGNIAMTYSSCGFGSSSTVWTGGQNINFGGGCPNPISAISGYGGNKLTRTFTAGTTETTSAGVTTTLDTTTASTSGWDSSVTGVINGETATFAGTTGNRTLALGIHLHGVDASANVLFDETVSASAVTVTGTGTSRSIATGTGVVTVQHNQLKYSAAVSITTALAYGTSGCCHPSSGVLTTQLSGSRSGIETLTFTGGTCGAATYVDQSGNSSSISLTHCF
jgi:hypothetical protein